MKDVLLQLLLLGWLIALCTLLLLVSAEHRSVISKNKKHSRY